MSNTHIELARLESRKFNCSVTSAGSAHDLTDCLITFTVKKESSYYDTQSLFQLTIGSGITITNTTGGEYDLFIASTLTTNVTKTNKNTSFVFDHRIKLADGAIKVLEFGDFVVRPGITETVS
jgi:hypothetical protein